MIMDFFDDAKPCPSDIPNCEQLRAQYKQELSEINPKTCKPCALNSLRAKFINILTHDHK